MQRVSALLPSWERRKSAGKAAVDKIFSWGDRPASALNGLTTPPAKIRREAFWPATLDNECDRAARILKSFCSDGYLVASSTSEDSVTDQPTPVSPNGAVKKIPPRILQNAAGIAIFTCMRSGLWMTGSGGSGILIARKADGTWSPPSGILLHTPTLSFIIGVDIYDCVLIINDHATLESLIRPKVTLGEDVGLTAGPLVQLGSTEVDVRWKSLGNTVLTYLKARGQAQDVNLNGCILSERANENERFYSGNVTVLDILAGNVNKNVEETRPLFEVIKAAEGRTDFDAGVISRIAVQPAPGDALIETPSSLSPASPNPAFGIPNSDDPDPFGVLALEMAGLEIREAGTRLRPTSHQFEFNPSPTSPVYSTFPRQSIDTYASRSNRGSYMSTRTERTKMSDACTQTDVANTPQTTPSPSQSEDGRDRASFDHFGLSGDADNEIDYTKIDLTLIRQLSGPPPLDAGVMTDSILTEKTLARDDDSKADQGVMTDEIPKAAIPESLETDEGADADDEDEEDEEEPVVVYEVAAAVQPARSAVATSQAIQAKGALVTIPKRIAPPLPVKSPARNSRSSKSEFGEITQSSLRHSLNEAVLESGDMASPTFTGVALAEPTHTTVAGDLGYLSTAAKDLEVKAFETQKTSPVEDGSSPDGSSPVTEATASPHQRSASATLMHEERRVDARSSLQSILAWGAPKR